jgi:hypothetical protein
LQLTCVMDLTKILALLPKVIRVIVRRLIATPILFLLRISGHRFLVGNYTELLEKIRVNDSQLFVGHEIKICQINKSSALLHASFSIPSHGKRIRSVAVSGVLHFRAID